MQNMNKSQIQEQMEKMKMSTDDIKESLDQQLQLYKQLEVEKKLNELVDNMKSLSKEMKENADRTLDKQNSKESLQKKHSESQQNKRRT